MAIQAACPGCGTVYKLGDDYLGKKVICKQCQMAFIVRSGRGPVAPESDSLRSGSPGSSPAITPGPPKLGGLRPPLPPRPPARPPVAPPARPLPNVSRQPPPAPSVHGSGRGPGARGPGGEAKGETNAPARSNSLIWIAAGGGVLGVLLLAGIITAVVLLLKAQPGAPVQVEQVAGNDAAGKPQFQVPNPKIQEAKAVLAPPPGPEQSGEAKPQKPSEPAAANAPADSPPDPKVAKSPDPAPAKAPAGVLAEPGAGGGRLSAEILQHLKQATVFIKREAGKLSASGSGFVMKIEGETAYVITNHHVVDPSAEMLRLGPGGRIQTVKVRANGAVILTIFRSGTKEERAMNAEVIASDSSRDLAVLKVNGVKDFAQAIDLDRKAQLVETMPVFILGFPFGKALSMNKGNPNITINKGTVSSLRENDRGQMKAVQIDGALNPGNSGGPVVDDQGHLVGVAVRVGLAASR